ncbi:MAG: hypothetical protein ACJ761_01570 [Chloroflexota bacterium]
MTDSAPATLPVPRFALGEGEAAYRAAVARARDERWVERLFERDTSLWSTDARVQVPIADRLGWLDAPTHFAGQIAALEGFGDGIVETGFTTAVVMGMGGSSLAPDVLRRTFGTTAGYLELRVLDSTDPAFVGATLDDLDPLRTVFIVATKSGTTTEPLAFLAAATARVEAALDRTPHRVFDRPEEVVVAITDPGASAEAIPSINDFREVFLNPPDIGGRYSALTYVGLVPASLIGVDLDPLLEAAATMLAATREPDPDGNPGASLGLAIGTLAAAGRDKLTFLTDPDVVSFGSWVEQLIAESTGKHGTGIVPVDLEPPGPAAAYGDDRVFVRISLAGSDDADLDRLADELEATGHPVIRIALSDPIDLGGEFVRWEVATALAGAVLGIDPFDQPNVEEAKQLTRERLDRHGRGRRPQYNPIVGSDPRSNMAPEPESVPVLAEQDGISLIGDTAMRLTAEDGTAVEELQRHLLRRRPNAYLAIQAFIAPTPERDAALTRLRRMLRDRTRRATTAGYGPRFLHSTGQLHKGGPPTGWFLQLTSDHPEDQPIPGWPYTFGQLIDAQAEGDFAAIEHHELPILRIHLGADVDAGLATLERCLGAALDERATPRGEG